MQMRRAVISVLTAALFCVPAQASTDITKLGPPGFALAGFGAMPGGYLVGSVRDFKAPYVSRNRGSTWVKASRPHPTAPVLAFLGSRTSPGTTWMGTSFGGVSVSHDGGRTSAVAGQLRTFTPIFQLGRRGALFVALTG